MPAVRSLSGNPGLARSAVRFARCTHDAAHRLADDVKTRALTITVPSVRSRRRKRISVEGSRRTAPHKPTPRRATTHRTKILDNNIHHFSDGASDFEAFAFFEVDHDTLLAVVSHPKNRRFPPFLNGGPQVRVSSPFPGDSSLMISAPRSESIVVQKRSGENSGTYPTREFPFNGPLCVHNPHPVLRARSFFRDYRMCKDAGQSVKESPLNSRRFSLRRGHGQDETHSSRKMLPSEVIQRENPVCAFERNSLSDRQDFSDGRKRRPARPPEDFLKRANGFSGRRNEKFIVPLHRATPTPWAFSSATEAVSSRAPETGSSDSQRSAPVPLASHR